MLVIQKRDHLFNAFITLKNQLTSLHQSSKIYPTLQAAICPCQALRLQASLARPLRMWLMRFVAPMVQTTTRYSLLWVKRVAHMHALCPLQTSSQCRLCQMPDLFSILFLNEKNSSPTLEEYPVSFLHLRILLFIVSLIPTAKTLLLTMWAVIWTWAFYMEAATRMWIVLGGRMALACCTMMFLQIRGC